MSVDGLSLRVTLRERLAGEAVIANGREEPVRVWRPGSELGDEPLRFELSNGARFTSNAVYTRNAPTAVELAPGEEVARAFDLEDGDWRAEGEAEGATDLVAVYEVPMTPEAAEQGVWVGTLRSGPIGLPASSQS